MAAIAADKGQVIPMTPLSIAALGLLMVATAFLSGLFGMAGGMILMGVLLALLPLAAAAQDPTTDSTLLGVGVRSRPAYDGSDTQRAEAVLVVRYYGPVLFVRSTRGPLEAGAHFEVLPGLNAGLQAAYEPGRQADESDFLENRRIPDVDAGASYGGHLEWNGKLGPSPVNLILRARKHTKAERGAQALQAAKEEAARNEESLQGLTAEITEAHNLLW